MVRPLTVSKSLQSGRRLGRIRLLPEPVLEQKPISILGFDPILSHPTFEEFQELIGKKKGTVKGVIMDQAFSAGVGNVSPQCLFDIMLMSSGWPTSEIHASCLGIR